MTTEARKSGQRAQFAITILVLFLPTLAMGEDGDPIEFIHNAGYDFTVLPDGDAVAAAYNVYGTQSLDVVLEDAAQ